MKPPASTRHLVVSFLGLAFALAAQPAPGPVDPWTKEVRLSPVSAVPGRHTIHTYYLANPESPDGKHVLFYSSAHPAGYVGEIRILERATGKETVLAENVHTEDAHRAACQQWLSGGKRVAYHEVIDKKWRVVVVDVATRTKTVVAEDRQVGFGQPTGDLLPMYGCHWNPGPYRDLYVGDARTGEVRVALKNTAVEEQHGAWLKQQFSGKPTSIFFPVISPDMKRTFFKIAAGNGGDNYMAKNASDRQGSVCFDLETGQMKWFRQKWGHPAWMPDSRRILEVYGAVFDTENGSQDMIPNWPKYPFLRGSHPSASPDGRLIVSDGILDPANLKEWAIVVVDAGTGKWVTLHRFDQSQGARSWRRNDPHPIFSADGRRIYYNVSDGPFTRLCVAEHP